MIKIETKGLDELIKNTKEIQTKQIPYTISTCLSKMAKEVKEGEIKEMQKIFNKPTPYTLNSIQTDTATKERLTAAVWFKSQAEKYLGPQVFGGDRAFKRMEGALRRVGVLPAGMYCVPGQRAKMDQYGNMDRGQIVQIISYFQAFGEQGYRANITDKRKGKLAKGTKSKRGYR